MKAFVFRIKRRMAMISNNFKSDCHFSLYYAILRIIDELGSRFHLKKIANIAHTRKDKWILSYLKRNLENTIQKYRKCDNTGVENKNSNIWVCWWTGEETAPDLVKRCIKSIRRNAGSHPVIFIDQNTYSSYIDIPDYMIKKVENGTMGLAHLSDYIRISLIAKYGGLWLDSTIFCAGNLPEDYFNFPFFSCKSNPTECGYVSQMQWTTFVLGGWKGNIFYQFMKEAFEVYWSKESGAIDYLFFDHLIELARREIPEILSQMESVPINNLQRDELQAAMNKNLSSECWNEVIKEDTVLYKLSWRECYKVKTNNGGDSIYKFFLEYHA